jgi:homoserine kinase|tara:strand:- start:6 stop:935 length:930 start_codon:yes stop_codon:yes gene_type:complete
MNEVKIFCPASVANVSCGFDILGFCLDKIGDEMIIRKTSNPGINITKIVGENLPYESKKNVAGVSGISLLNEFSTDFGFEIEIYKGIKSGSGIGSSAASSAGAVFGINELLGKPFSRKELIKFAMKGEELASGSIHADNVAPVLLGGFTLVRDINSLDIISLPFPKNLFASIIHPEIELKTSDSRSVLKQKVPLKKAIQQSANIASLISGLYTEDYKLISRSLIDVLVEPYRSDLIPAFNDLKKTSSNNGSLGTGISGSGPSVFALSKGEKTAKSVTSEMGKVLVPLNLKFHSYTSKINSTGIKLISSR